MAESLRSRVYESLETTALGNRLGRWIDGFLIALILANVAAITLETVDPLVEQHAYYFHFFEISSVAVFTVEYAARLWTCVESPRPAYQRPVAGRPRAPKSLKAQFKSSRPTAPRERSCVAGRPREGRPATPTPEPAHRQPAPTTPFTILERTGRP